MRLLTQSEDFFETYCRRRGYPFNRMRPVPAEGRFPDYEVVTPLGPVICEVKQINPNNYDREYDRRLERYGCADSSRELGKRARVSLKDACGQLRRFRNDQRPCVAVMVDTTYRDYLSPPDIEAAMFGDLVVLLPVEPRTGAAEFTYGLNRRLNEKRGLYLGAVTVLARSGRLDVYHNPYAQKRVPPGCFPDPQDRHFMKRRHPDKSGHGWCEYVGNDTKTNAARRLPV